MNGTLHCLHCKLLHAVVYLFIPVLDNFYTFIGGFQLTCMLAKLLGSG
jgi:hypothetical protein